MSTIWIQVRPNVVKQKIQKHRKSFALILGTIKPINENPGWEKHYFILRKKWPFK